MSDNEPVRVERLHAPSYDPHAPSEVRATAKAWLDAVAEARAAEVLRLRGKVAILRAKIQDALDNLREDEPAAYALRSALRDTAEPTEETR